jgi:hypothetical protein
LLIGCELFQFFRNKPGPIVAPDESGEPFFREQAWRTDRPDFVIDALDKRDETVSFENVMAAEFEGGKQIDAGGGEAL